MHWAIVSGLSALVYAFWALFLRIGTATYSWKDVLFFAAVSEMLVILALFWPRQMPALPAISWGLAAGACAAVGYTLFVFGLASAKSTMPVVVMSMYPVLVIILAYVILHEQMDWTRWLGVGLAMVALWLVSR